MSLFFKPRKARSATKPKAKTPVETVKLRLAAIQADRYGCPSYRNHYDFGDRYTVESVRRSQGVISIRDNVARVSGTVVATGKEYWAAVGDKENDRPAFAKGYRLPNATSSDVQSYTLIDDAFLMRLVEESQKNEPEAWEAARTAAREDYFADIQYNFRWGAAAWGLVFTVATFIMWSSQVSGF